MNKLQQLLDEKWPMTEVHSNTDKSTYEMFRRIYSEGYNAAMLYGDSFEAVMYESYAQGFTNGIKGAEPKFQSWFDFHFKIFNNG